MCRLQSNMFLYLYSLQTLVSFPLQQWQKHWSCAAFLLGQYFLPFHALKDSITTLFFFMSLIQYSNNVIQVKNKYIHSIVTRVYSILLWFCKNLSKTNLHDELIVGILMSYWRCGGIAKWKYSCKSHHTTHKSKYTSYWFNHRLFISLYQMHNITLTSMELMSGLIYPISSLQI